MRQLEKDYGLLYIPADEKRLAGARDVYQTAVRLRPVLNSVFRIGGTLDSLLLSQPDIEDRDTFQTEQMVAGKVIPQMCATRTDRQVSCAAEIGYLRHVFTASSKSHPGIISMLGITREIALRSSMHLNLPPAPAVIFDPVHIPDPKELLFGGMIVTFDKASDSVQPIHTYTEGQQPQVLWKIDPTPSYFYPIASPNAPHPVYQGDLIISHEDAAVLAIGADYVAFFDPQSATYRADIYEHMRTLQQVQQ